jgi:putative RNA 2'-phosphotransferase
MAADRIKISKFLSLVLRHKPQEIGISLDDAGWVDVDTLLTACANHRFRITRQQLDEVVATSDKKRFAFSEDGTRIRANQGHSVQVELGYEPAKPPEILYHGTADRFVESIRRQGLLKGKRHHVHLSVSRETAAAVGTRHGRLVLLEVRAGEMHRAGVIFYKTPNNVWLTDLVPQEYLVFP